MGRRQAGARKQVYFCVAVLILLLAAGCALTSRDTKRNEATARLALGRTLFAKGDYGGALREHEKAVTLAGHGPVAAEALLYTGLIYADSANPKRDYGKSAVYFKKLAKQYPNSPFAEQAKIMVAILQENDQLSRTNDQLSRTNDRLSRTVERLNEIIENSKKVDIGIEDKKRERAR